MRNSYSRTIIYFASFSIPRPHPLERQREREILRKTCILKKGNQVVINWIPPDAHDNLSLDEET